MRKSKFRKGLVLGIIVLFLGASIVQGLIDNSGIINDNISTENLMSDDWWDTDWRYRKQITINHSYVDGNLTNFPVLVAHTSEDFKDYAQPDGDDFVFTGFYGIKLNHEIEYYNNTNGEILAWVNVTYLPATVNTILYLYYGNPSCSNQQNIEDTWNSHYMAVWHLHENPEVAVHDSTSNNNDGISFGSMTSSDLVDGKVGKCLDFDGINDYISVPDDSTLKPTDVTLTAWYKLLDEDVFWGLPISKSCHDYWDNADGHSYAFYSSTGDQAFITAIFERNSPEQWEQVGEYYTTNDIWYHLMLTFTETTDTAKFYVNGMLNATNSPCHSSVLWYPNAWAFLMGACKMSAGSSQIVDTFYKCRIDEVRVLNTALNSAWISTEYNNQNNLDSFMNFGTQEVYNQPPGTPIINGATSGKAGDPYSYTFVVVDPDDNDVFYEIDWGDGIVDPWDGPHKSNKKIIRNHTWEEEGTFTIMTRAKDIHDAIGDWGTLKVTMPKNKPYLFNFLLLNWLVERFPLLQRLLIAFGVNVL